MTVLAEIRSAFDRLSPWASRPAITHHFIHIPKNGGNAVRAALKRRRSVSMSDPYHYRYVDIADVVGREKTYFCIVRNPWSRTASRYLFAKQNSASWAENDPRRMYIRGTTFDDYVRDQRIFEIPEHPGKPWMGPMNSWFDQLEWIRNESGAVMADCLRFEHMDEDLSAYFDEEIRLPQKNVTREKYDYRKMFSDETFRIVETIFARDIAYFGFTFDEAATRNIAVM